MNVQWFVGLDWGKQHHHICLLDHEGRPSCECVIPHTGEGFIQLARWLAARTQNAAPATIGVVLETSRGPVVSCCQAREYEVYAINPKQSDRFRDRYSPAGAKDDRGDALVQATILHTEPRALRRVEVTDEQCVQLRSRNRLRYDLLKTKVRLILRMRQKLWEYFPSFDSLFGADLAESFVHTLWHRIPNPHTAHRTRVSTVATIFKQHQIRRFEAAKVVAQLRTEPIQITPVETEMVAEQLASLWAQLKLVNQQIHTVEQQIEDSLTALKTDTDDDLDQSCSMQPYLSDAAILAPCQVSVWSSSPTGVS